MRNSLLTAWLLIPLFLGIPVTIAAQNATTMNSSAPDTVVGWYTGSSEGSTLSLVYSCLMTTFACTWTVLHLNVPKLGESSWTRFTRKVKWMVITILLPEFIFSKAVCELRLALKDLHAFDKRLREDYDGGIGYREHLRDWADEKVVLFRQWRVKYSAFVLLLFPLFGLPRPDTQTCSQQNAIGMEHLDRAEINGEAIVEDSSKEAMDHNSRPPSQRSSDKDKPSTNPVQQAEQRAWGFNLVPGMTTKGTYDAHVPTLPILYPERPHSAPSKGDDNLEAYERGLRCQSLPNMHRGYTHNQQNRSDVEIRRDTQTRLNTLRSSIRRYGERPLHTVHEWQDWTLAHSYLANMGGIIYDYLLWGDKISHRVVTGNIICDLSWKGEKHPLEQLVLSQEDIVDRSKADWFLRALAILQISWLVLTVIARRTASLPLTQLELATSAFSIFAVATYAVNWWKPKDISQPIRLPGWSTGILGHSETTQPFVSHFGTLGRSTDLVRKFRYGSRITNDVVELQGRFPLISQLIAFAAFVFGGIHCLAWNFTFPTRAEAILWRSASVASALVPILPLAVSIIANHVMTVVENDAARFIESKLNCLGDLPSDYTDLLVEPRFKQWNTGTSDFSHEPSEEEIQLVEHWKRIQNSPEFLTMDNDIFGALRSLLSWLEGERGNPTFDWLFQQVLHFRCPLPVGNFLIEYEKSFVKNRAPPAQDMPSRRTVMEYILRDLRAFAMDRHSKIQNTKKICARISSFSALLCGTIYIAARVVIVVLLFTSLREAPLGVYKETPWTRLLPSFS